mmetsp:Transcript_83863/g.237589  ORF Transcript_83863/g.237589 Transcript_83863/m.237589 type:complete len:220 (-) Transcript_83863:115-774(-)
MTPPRRGLPARASLQAAALAAHGVLAGVLHQRAVGRQRRLPREHRGRVAGTGRAGVARERHGGPRPGQRQLLWPFSGVLDHSRHGVLVGLALAGRAHGLEAPAPVPRDLEEPSHDEGLLVASFSELVTTELLALGGDDPAVRIGHGREGPVLRVYVYHEEYLLDLWGDGLQVQRDALVVPCAVPCQVVPRVSHAARLLVAEEAAVYLVGVAIKKDGRDV